MNPEHTIQQCVHLIQNQLQTLEPKIAIILGSGLGLIAEQVENGRILSYKDLPGFPKPSIYGHAGKMHIGLLNGVPVICLQGRAHFYEGLQSNTLKTQIRTLKHLGVEKLIITNAAGCLNPHAEIGSLMLINDHINMQGINPLTGPNQDEYGPRFISMDNVYDGSLRQTLVKAAAEMDMLLPEGVYIGVLGPSFETPAEIRAFKTLGADLVGMSTIGEVIVAHHCGLKIAAISAITNLAAGLSTEELSHHGTLDNAVKASHRLNKLLHMAIGALAHV